MKDACQIGRLPKLDQELAGVRKIVQLVDLAEVEAAIPRHLLVTTSAPPES